MTISWPAANLGAEMCFLSPSQSERVSGLLDLMHTGRSGGLGQATSGIPQPGQAGGLGHAQHM